MGNATAELYWDPFDTEIDSSPYEVWRRMRDDAPVFRNDRYDFFALSRNKLYTCYVCVNRRT